jgi:hypothetical protein
MKYNTAVYTEVEKKNNRILPKGQKYKSVLYYVILLIQQSNITTS